MTQPSLPHPAAEAAGKLHEKSLEHRLRDWTTPFNASKAPRDTSKSWANTALWGWGLKEYVDTARHLGVNLITNWPIPTRINQFVRKAAQRLSLLDPLGTVVNSSLQRHFASSTVHFFLMMDYAWLFGSSLPEPTSRNFRWCSPACLRRTTNAPWHTGNKLMH